MQICRDKYTCIHTDRQTDTYIETDTDRQTHPHMHIHIHAHTDRQTDGEI